MKIVQEYMELHNLKRVSENYLENGLIIGNHDTISDNSLNKVYKAILATPHTFDNKNSIAYVFYNNKEVPDKYEIENSSCNIFIGYVGENLYITKFKAYKIVNGPKDGMKNTYFVPGLIAEEESPWITISKSSNGIASFDEKEVNEFIRNLVYIKQAELDTLKLALRNKNII